jgi:hypothetical protein
MQDAYIQDEEPAPTLFKVFESASDIAYAPEEALKAGLDMVSGIQEVLKKIHLSSKMRQEVWMREIETLARFLRIVQLCLMRIYIQSSKSRCTKNIDRSMWWYVFSAVFILITRSHHMFPATGAGKSSILNAVLDGNCQYLAF